MTSFIRIGQAYEKYNLEWMEDVIPWWCTDQLKMITDQSPTPTITGENIYEIADFETLCKNHAVDKTHPDLATSRGDSADAQDREHGPQIWRADGDALRGDTGELHG